MIKKMLINAAEPEERRMAIVEDGILSELIIETSLQELSRGNIYKAKIVNIEPSLQATFVDYGEARHGFLPFSEIHPNYYTPAPGGEPREGRPRVQEAIKRNQEVLVQVEKEEKGTKGAALTTYISLAGRYLVLMPGSDGGGISRKIEGEKDRKHIKEIVRELGGPRRDGAHRPHRRHGKKQNRAFQGPAVPPPSLGFHPDEIREDPGPGPHLPGAGLGLPLHPGLFHRRISRRS